MKNSEKQGIVMMPVIDAHIHFDQYKKEEQNLILDELEKYQVKALLSVSTDLNSAQKNLALARMDSRVKPAFGFHPEQPLPGEEELQKLLNFIDTHHQDMIAVGEIGLPYYLKLEAVTMQRDAYIELLEELIKVAVKYNKPVALHAIYEDAPIVIDLLEKYSVQKAHFHWFKGDKTTLQHTENNGYFISFTPDVVYEEEIQMIVQNYPLSQLMVETDGPWPFEGPFQDQMTHPKMMHEAVRVLAKLKKIDLKEVYQQLHWNTESFYSIAKS